TLRNDSGPTYSLRSVLARALKLAHFRQRHGSGRLRTHRVTKALPGVVNPLQPLILRWIERRERLFAVLVHCSGFVTIDTKVFHPYHVRRAVDVRPRGVAPSDHACRKGGSDECRLVTSDEKAKISSHADPTTRVVKAIADVPSRSYALSQALAGSSL